MAVGKWVFRLAAIFVALGLFWLALSQTVAHLYAARSPEMALRLRSSSVEALNIRNSDRVSRGEKEQGPLAASLASAPLNSVAIRNLATAAGNAGDTARSDRLLALAGRQTRRDTLVQQSLYYRALLAGNYQAAFSAMDSLLRRRVVSMRLLMPDLAPALRQPAAVSALAAQLAASPPWRADMISQLGAGLRNADQLSAIFDQMTAKGSPPTRDEKRQLVILWVQGGEYDRAARAAGATPGQITDGEFDGSDVGIPFNWNLQSTGQVTAELSLGSNGQKSLRAGWPAGRTATITQQLLLLSPGAYRFSGSVRAETLPNGAWIIWDLSCDKGGDGTPLAETRQTEEGDWTGFTASFNVPSGCPAVWLTLRSIGGDGQSYATVWYDHLVVARVGG